MTPRGILNQNPGNIRPTSIVWHGQTGSQNGYLVFDTPENGLRALAKDILYKFRVRGLRTVRSIITRYAPPYNASGKKENDTESYILHMCDILRVGDFTHLDLTDRQVLMQFMNGIVWHENGMNPYTHDLMLAAADDALGAKTVKPITTQPGATA